MRRCTILALVLLVGAAMLIRLLPPEGAPVSAATDSRFGIDFVSSPGTVASESRFGQATATGAGWDRFPMYWSSMQSSRSAAIDYSGTDPTANADLAHGLNVQAILVGAPSWATANGSVDLDAWSSFVSAVVTHYRGQIHYWEMWNEPDLLDGQGNGLYWTWGVPAYYQLLKSGYLAAKAADPSVTVLLGGLAFPYNNTGFFSQLLAQMAADPSSAPNHGYFDVLAFHSYDEVARMYELPLGYLGTPSFTGFWPLLRRQGLNPPIWVNELGVPIWNFTTGKNAPGRSTQDEQASYIVESIADGLAAGIDRYFLFQLYDDGAGAIDPTTNQPAEFFGLISNAGATRPGYQAYQAATSILAGAQLATHGIGGRGSQFQNHKGVEIVTLYGANRGRVTIVWNDDPGNPVSVAIPTNASGATQVDKLGRTVGPVTASGGYENVTLLPATNNNNFDCFSSHGCDLNDYIIGGSPVILIENDATVPTVAFDPLPFDSIAPIHLSWHATTGAPPSSYDIQYRDATDGVWRDWLVGTTATDAQFGDGSMQLQSGHTYDFRARGHDGAGNLSGGLSYLPRPLASTQVIGGNVVISPGTIDSKIEIVWPHDNKPVSKATLANVTAAIFDRGTLTSVSPGTNNAIHLWRALDNGVAQQVSTGVKRLTNAGKISYPVWDFNDIDVSAAQDGKHRYYFWTTVDGLHENSTVWSHGVDARTNFPTQDKPSSVLTTSPAAVDAKIEIVWPHDNLPVAKAKLANIGVDLFSHGTLQSVPLNYSHPVQLLRSDNGGPLVPVGNGDRDRKSVV